MQNARYPPFLGFNETLETFLYWQQTSDLHTRPHVQHFDSIPDLLEHTLSKNLHEISLQMRHHNMELRSRALAFWAGVISKWEPEAEAT